MISILKNIERKYSNFLRNKKIMFYQLLLYKHLSEKVWNEENIGYEIDIINLIDSVVERINNDAIQKNELSELLFNIELSSRGTIAEQAFRGVFDNFYIEDRDFPTIKNLICDVANMDAIDFNQVLHYFMKNDIRSGFSTPVGVNKLISKLVSSKFSRGSVFDSCCGTSSAMLEIGNNALVDKYIGIDISHEQVIISKIHMLIKNIPYDKYTISCADALSNNAYNDEKFDMQICIAPMGINWSGNQTLLSDSRFSEYEILPPKSDATLLFVENVIAHMSAQGRAAIIVNMHTLNAGAAIGKIRKKVVEKNIIDAIIKLPSDSVYGTGISTYILLLDNNKTKQNIFYLDSTKYFEGKKLLEISDKNINDIFNLYLNRQNVNDLCIVATNKSIANNNYKLGIEQYLLRHKVERLLKKETLVPLTDVAEILKPRVKNKSLIVKTISGKASYPIDYTSLKEIPATTIILQRGDLLFKRGLLKSMYLVDEELQQDIYAEPSDVVIRAYNIPPEYLYVFLKSDVGKEILYINSPSMIGTERISEIDIPLPKKDVSEYRKIFEIENHLKIDISTYNTIIANKDKYFTAEYVEDILDSEYATNAKTYKKEAMQAFLYEDIKELNSCFKAKAYKATLILAGSILEAVLIDWLSEIHKKDYFQEEYYIVDSKTGKHKRAELVDYINEIKYIERPYWMEEASKAHEIRKKRNLVHAKLCMNSDEINEHVARTVIKYLKDVLKTRGIK